MNVGGYKRYVKSAPRPEPAVGRLDRAVLVVCTLCLSIWGFLLPQVHMVNDRIRAGALKAQGELLDWRGTVGE